MKKQWISLLLALTMLLLCGCNGNTASTGSTGTNPTNTGMASTTTADLESNIYHQKVMEQVYEPPVYDGQPLIPYDPDRQVYISLANQDCDFYPDYGSNGVMFWIITREHYASDDIQVHIDTSVKYEVTVADMTESCQELSHNAFYPNFGLQKYQYMCMQKLDWRELARIAIYAKTAAELARRHAPSSEEYAGYMALQTEYWTLSDSYTNQYQAVNMETMPKFSAYRVSVNFRELSSLNNSEEIVETVEFKIGGSTYTQNIGQWRLHNFTPTEILDAIPTGVGITSMRSVTTALGSPALADGFENLLGLFWINATEDLTVTGVRQFETGDRAVDIIGAKIQLLDKEAMEDKGKQVVLMEYFWDLAQPLDIAAGTLAKIDLYVQDERMKNFDGCFTAYFFLDYTVRDQTDAILSPCRLSRLNDNVWDTYLMAFEGVDMGEYYNVYYASTSDWRWELPEAWRP